MTHKLSRGSLSMIKLTVPLAMEQFFRILVSSVDTFMLSTFSEQAVAGVGLVGQYVFFLQILFNVVCIGASIVLAQYLGAEKSDDELNYISGKFSNDYCYFINTYCGCHSGNWAFVKLLYFS